MNRHLSRFVRVVKESRWAPLALKAVGVMACVTALGVVGSGFLDHWIKPAKASVALATPVTDATTAPLASSSDPMPVGSVAPAPDPTTTASSSEPSCDVVD